MIWRVDSEQSSKLVHGENPYPWLVCQYAITTLCCKNNVFVDESMDKSIDSEKGCWIYVALSLQSERIW